MVLEEGAVGWLWVWVGDEEKEEEVVEEEIGDEDNGDVMKEESEVSECKKIGDGKGKEVE